MFDPVDPPSSFFKNLAPGKLRQLDQEGRTSHWLPTDARIRTGTMIGGAGFLSFTTCFIGKFVVCVISFSDQTWDGPGTWNFPLKLKKSKLATEPEVQVQPFNLLIVQFQGWGMVADDEGQEITHFTATKILASLFCFSMFQLWTRKIWDSGFLHEKYPLVMSK